MSFMPSQSYVASALYNIGGDRDWGEAPQEEQNTHMEMAKVAIAAIQSWQAKHRATERSDRYCFEQSKDTEGNPNGWAIFDRLRGMTTGSIGMVHDALLAQQIVDDLNGRETEKKSQYSGL